MTKRLLLIVVLCTLGPGCGPICHGIRLTIVEPSRFNTPLDKHLRRARHRRLAGEAWGQSRHNTPGGQFSADYERGFKKGFSDYLDAGGTGDAPPLPPRKYWNRRYATSEGRGAVQNWYAGFRHGAAMAYESGCRQLATVPSSVLPYEIAGPHLPQVAPRPTVELLPLPTTEESHR